ITPGGNSSPLRSLAIFSSVIFSRTAIWRDVISSISSICSLSRGSLLCRRMRFRSRDFIFSISSRVSSVSFESRRLLVFSSCRSASSFLPSSRLPRRLARSGRATSSSRSARASARYLSRAGACWSFRRAGRPAASCRPAGCPGAWRAQVARLHLLDQLARQLGIFREQALVGLFVVQVGQQLLAVQQAAQALGALVGQDSDFILQVALQALDLRFLDGFRPLVLLLALTRENLAIHNGALDSGRAVEGSVLHIPGLFAEDGAQQLFFRSELGFALGRHFTHQNV